jgi:hypothetical protein
MATEARVLAEPEPVHRAVCSWCKREMRAGVEPVTHSICEECAGNFRETKGGKT